ncbi:hypothetical protein ADH76_17585 [Enterocloster clostridioformis]|nr:hypothetical protein A4V08_07790 [Lachnoclostridium sp. YL32]OXE67768.1 hypothetical protein ADH76_17585 [Enterocloster clostridioformis]
MPKISSLIPEAGCGQSPQKKANCKCLIFDTKKQKECIKNSFVVILKLESIIDNKILHIYLLSEELISHRHKIFYALAVIAVQDKTVEMTIVVASNFRNTFIISIVLLFFSLADYLS